MHSFCNNVDLQRQLLGMSSGIENPHNEFLNFTASQISNERSGTS
jgi:hypothetical protein